MKNIDTIIKNLMDYSKNLNNYDLFIAEQECNAISYTKETGILFLN